ncbi:MAG: M12 family metallo-peptidase [Pirellula sp.]
MKKNNSQCSLVAVLRGLSTTKTRAKSLAKAKFRPLMFETMEPRLAMNADLAFLPTHEMLEDSHVDASGYEMHALTLLPKAADPVNPQDTLSTYTPTTLANTFLLHSKPDAPHKIYLDFDGHITSGTNWNTYYAGGQNIITPAYDFDGNVTAFSNAELERIQWIWERVAEDFIPFNVDVTTQDPGLAALIKSGTTDTSWGIRALIGGSSMDWYGAAAGGVAYVSSFNWATDTPTFVFEAQLGNGNEKYTAEAISHEVGHTLGLSHDGRISPLEEYYQGHGTGETGWAPIMGSGYSYNVTQWSKGEYASASQTQDDLTIITSNNGFSFRVDDRGNTNSTAAALSVVNNAIKDWGIIERVSDVDVFSFATGAGTMQINVSPFNRGPNLDVQLPSMTRHLIWSPLQIQQTCWAQVLRSPRRLSNTTSTSGVPEMAIRRARATAPTLASDSTSSAEI